MTHSENCPCSSATECYLISQYTGVCIGCECSYYEGV